MQAGIDMQVLSMPTWVVQDMVDQPEEALRLARMTNDTAAEAIKAHPDRFSAFAHAADRAAGGWRPRSFDAR